MLKVDIVVARYFDSLLLLIVTDAILSKIACIEARKASVIPPTIIPTAGEITRDIAISPPTTNYPCSSPNLRLIHGASWAAAAESRSDHFFAQALRRRLSADEGKAGRGTADAAPGAARRGTALVEPESVEVFSGQGVSAGVQGRRVMVGSLSWLAGNGVKIEPDLLRRLDREPRALSAVALDGKLVGIILYSETYREGNLDDVRRLGRMGINVVLVSGDREPAVRLAAEKAGIAKTYAEALEGDKLRIIRELKASGNVVAMVGDGVHDVAAMSRADLAMALAPLPPDIGPRGRRALGAGIDLAAESADIVLDRRDLGSLTAGIRIGVQVRRAVKANLIWALLLHVALLPLAGGVLFLTTGTGLRFGHLLAAAAASALLIAMTSWRRFSR